MDQPQYSTVLDALRHVPDPRRARGKRHDWALILSVIASAVLSQQRSAAAIAHWVDSHTPLLLHAFQPPRRRMPSEATIRRVLRHIDVAHLNTISLNAKCRHQRRVRPPQFHHAGRRLMVSTCVVPAPTAIPRCSLAWWYIIRFGFWPNGGPHRTSTKAKRLHNSWLDAT